MNGLAGESRAKMPRYRGFTLVEMIIAIVIVGILSIGATRFITASVGGYVDTAQRQQLATAGLLAAEKVSRDLRNALPNSIRLRASDLCIEYIPIEGGTDYITIPVDTAGNKLVTLSANITLSSSFRFVVYPLNTIDLYNRPDPGPVSPVFSSSTGGADDSEIITLAANHRFATDSPTRRLYVVSSPKAYCFDDTKLYYYSGYATYEGDGRPDSSTRMVILDDLQTTGGLSEFDYVPASLVRNAVVNFRFSLSNGLNNWLTEQEVQIRNVP
mgnify:CR=1 FL=1